jgi:tetratricopeptide (TPR) repeat protein
MKNEGRYLRKCIESVLPVVSSIVIVDTGSTDDSIKIASDYTSQVYSFPFNHHFSNARNEALKYVNTPWTLFLDADESFELQDAQTLLQTALDAPSDIWGYRITRYNFFGTGGWYTSKNLKLFRNQPNIFYEGAVSESVTDSIHRGKGRIVDAPVLLNHFGHYRSIEDRNKKAHFYLDLMLKEIASSPHNSRLMGYAGMILRTLGRFNEALEMVGRAVLISPQSAHAHYSKAQVLRSLGNFQGALQSYLQAALIDKEDAMTWNMVGVVEMSLGHYLLAKQAFEKTLLLNPLLIHVHINLGLLAQAEENWEEASRHFEIVVQRNRGFLEEDFTSRFECDPFREFYFETIFKYAGLKYHLAVCKESLYAQTSL